jgi:hypothetical protein
LGNCGRKSGFFEESTITVLSTCPPSRVVCEECVIRLLRFDNVGKDNGMARVMAETLTVRWSRPLLIHESKLRDHF